MRFTTPNVTGGRLYRLDAESDPIVLGTPEWYDWLEQHTAFTFVDAAGTFKARKSMLRTGGSYWKHTAHVKASSTVSTWDTHMR